MNYPTILDLSKAGESVVEALQRECRTSRAAVFLPPVSCSVFLSALSSVLHKKYTLSSDGDSEQLDLIASTGFSCMKPPT